MLESAWHIVRRYCVMYEAITRGETTRSQYQEAARGSHGEAWTGCKFLERSDRSVKKEAIDERRRKIGKGKARHAGKHTGPGRPHETEYTVKGPKGYFYYSVPIPAGQGWKLTQ